MDYKITINASREKVWKALWENDTYRQWTSAFAEGSRAESDWNEGSKVLFLDGEGQGMVSRIAEKKTNEYMSFEHLGSVIKGVEYVDRPEDEIWKGSRENYTLKSVDGDTELSVHLDEKGMDKKMLEYFNAAWPKALDRLKEISERKASERK